MGEEDLLKVIKTDEQGIKNIAVGGFFHESNTFNPIITGLDDFIIFEQEEIYRSGTAFPLAKGIVDYFKDKSGYNLLPLVFARAVPNGEVDEKLYRKLKAGFFRLLKDVNKVDAFVLALHGSMRVRNIGSAESDLLVSIKNQYPDTPVFCGLDMHATVTQAMLESADAFVGFKTAPHTDAYETGQQVAQIADFALSSGIKLCMGAAKADCLIAGEKSETDCEPMKSLIEELKRLELEEEVLAASYLLGFPWADTRENGVTSLVVTKNNNGKAHIYANDLKVKFLRNKNRFGFSSPAYPPEKALTLALQEKVKPVFVSDSGDNPTAGSTADNTNIIRLLSGRLRDKTKGKSILVAGIYDPEAVRLCRENLDKVTTFKVGSNFDREYCKPVELSGIPVLWIEKFGSYRAELAVLRTDEFDLILTSKHIGFTGVEMFETLQIDYLNKDVIVVKLGYLTEEFKAIAAKSYLALTRGCSDEVLARLTYQKRYDLI